MSFFFRKCIIRVFTPRFVGKFLIWPKKKKCEYLFLNVGQNVKKYLGCCKKKYCSFSCVTKVWKVWRKFYKLWRWIHCIDTRIIDIELLKKWSLNFYSNFFKKFIRIFTWIESFELEILCKNSLQGLSFWLNEYNNFVDFEKLNIVQF